MPAKASQVIDAPRIKARVNSANTGAAPKIRRLKVKYPDMTGSEIARRVGCDPANVHRVLQRFLGDKITEQEHKTFADNQADALSRVKHRIIMSITDADIQKASLLQRATAFGIVHDKEQVLRGHATSISVNVLLDAVQAIREMRGKE